MYKYPLNIIKSRLLPQKSWTNICPVPKANNVAEMDCSNIPYMLNRAYSFGIIVSSCSGYKTLLEKKKNELGTRKFIKKPIIEEMRPEIWGFQHLSSCQTFASHALI